MERHVIEFVKNFRIIEQGGQGTQWLVLATVLQELN